MKTWRAWAPSNIALIKYMGKADSALNLPTNTSISYTVDHLRSLVTLEESDEDRWEPLLTDEGRPLTEIHLSQKGQARFLAHLDRLKREFSFTGGFVVRSANDFPSDCGLASSAALACACT